MICIFSFLALVLAAVSSAAAASSPWFESEGGAVRLVTSGLAGENGRLRGALQIRLKPGWKTYWRDPGEAGVPPQIELAEASDITDAEIHFPPPERVTDAYATWAGYRESVALPIVFRAPAAGAAGIVEGSVFVGICETICIPFEATFSFDAGADPDNAADGMVVSAAFAALPSQARPGFKVNGARRQDDRLVLEAELPEGAEAPALFVAGPEGVRLSVPALELRRGRSAAFAAAILSAPPDEAVRLDYTLVAGEEAVNGTVLLP